MNKDKTTESVNESGLMRMRRRAESGLKNLTTNSSDANRANVKGVRNASLRRQTRLVRTGHIYRGGNVAHGDGPNSPRIPPKNRNRKIITNSFNHGLDEGRYERLRAADIKRHGYTELPGRSDPKRAAVFNANTRRIARDRRLAGIVPGSANARPENRSDVLIHSARMSGKKRAAGIPSPRIPRKNRNLTNSFNHGLEEAKRPTTPKRPIKQSRSIFGAGVQGAIRGLTTPKPAGTSRTTHVVRQALGNIARHVMDKFL